MRCYLNIMRATFLFAIISTLIAVDAAARCVYSPPTFAEVSVEACAVIEGDPGLFVTGRVIGYIDLTKKVSDRYSITRIDEWESTTTERFVWTQPRELHRNCEYITSQKPLLVTLTVPCCDVQVHEIKPDGSNVRTGKPSCIHGLREISEIKMDHINRNSNNKSQKTDSGDSGAG